MVDGLDIPPGGVAWDETLAFRASDNVRLRGAIWRGGERGLVFLLPGRTEFLEKCAVSAAGLVQRGFSVASVDWRGQGLSQRLVGDSLKGHVTDFADYHLDLAALMAHPQVAAIPGRRLMLAHSMGSVIGLGAIARGQFTPEAAILSAPMLGLPGGRLGRFAGAMILPLARSIGSMDRWPPFAPRRPYVFKGFNNNGLTGDRPMFDWMAAALRRQPGLQLAAPTMAWIDAALTETDFLAQQGALECPAMCLLGTKERVVDARAIRVGAARMKAELVVIEGGRHELLIEAEPLRSQTWAAIDRFLEMQGI